MPAPPVARAAFAASLLFAACGDDGSTPTDDAAAVDASTHDARSSDLHAAAHDLRSADLTATTPVDLASPAAMPDLVYPGKPGPGNITPTGGTVDRLYFAAHGDTRPPTCDDVSGYPTTIITNIFNQEAAQGVQFAVDVGDHMFACSNASSSAQPQMSAYMSAASKLGRLVFMTMGNHECASAQSYCTATSSSPNYKAFMSALKPISTKPYYTFDIQTFNGKATFVIIADNAWDATQSAWLTSTLSTADTAAKYTIIARHHPIGSTDLATLADEWKIISAHKYALFLTGHTHEYKHDTYLDGSGRTVRLGNAGAPLDPTIPTATWYGYATVEQSTIGELKVTVYDQATNQVMDAFALGPNH